MKHTAKRILCLLLAAFLCAGLVCVTAFAEPAQAEELPAEGTLARNVLDNCKYTLDLGSWLPRAVQATCRASVPMTRATICTRPLPICW